VVTAGYLNTRGRERHRDYQFVGPAPPTSWWRAYADHTTFERPTVLVQSDGRRWQAYLSGIPSRRRDAVGTVIRYTVVAEGAADQPGAAELPIGADLGTGDVLALVANWLADQHPGQDSGRVSAVLDAAFPEPDVERLLAADPAGPARSEVGHRLVGALRELRLPVAAESEPVPAGWLADLRGPAARAAFVQRVGGLLAGQPGRALVLNLVGNEADLAALTADPRPLAVLAPDLPDPSRVVPLIAASGEPAKKAPPPPGTIPPEPATTRGSTSSAALRNLRGCLRLILVPLALILALALALLGTLSYLR
jgi:hypothetical protein